MPIELKYKIHQSVNKSMKEIMEFIIEYSNEHGYMPENHEIATGTHKEATTVQSYLAKMVKLGIAEKTGEIVRRGRPEGWKFYPEKMGIKESETNE